MVKRSIDQKIRLRKFDARHEKIKSGAVVKSRKGLIGVEGGKRYLLPLERKKGSVRSETNVVSGMGVTIVQDRHRKPYQTLSHNLQKHKVQVRQDKGTSEAEANLGSSIDSRANTS